MGEARANICRWNHPQYQSRELQVHLGGFTSEVAACSYSEWAEIVEEAKNGTMAAFNAVLCEHLGSDWVAALPELEPNQGIAVLARLKIELSTP